MLGNKKVNGQPDIVIKIFVFLFCRLLCYYLLIPFFFLFGICITILILAIQGSPIYTLSTFFVGIESTFGISTFNSSDGFITDWSNLLEMYWFIYIVFILIVDILFSYLKKKTSMNININRYKIKYIVIILSVLLIVGTFVMFFKNQSTTNFGFFNLMRVTITTLFFAIITFYTTQLSYYIYNKTKL